MLSFNQFIQTESYAKAYALGAPVNIAAKAAMGAGLGRIASHRKDKSETKEQHKKRKRKAIIRGAKIGGVVGAGQSALRVGVGSRIDSIMK